MRNHLVDGCGEVSNDDDTFCGYLIAILSIDLHLLHTAQLACL